MRVVIDIETNSLTRPTNIWLVVCKDIDTEEFHIFRNLTIDKEEKDKFDVFCEKVSLWIGHNLLDYDLPVLRSLIDFHVKCSSDVCIDTLILSHLIDYPREGHSIRSYGEEFGLEKIDFSDYTQYSKELEEYCVRDVEICHKIYLKYLRYLSNPSHLLSVRMEHDFQLVVNDLHHNGFSFNTVKASKILEQVTTELGVFDKEILKAFPPKPKMIREVHPKETKHGTLSKTDFRFVKDGDLSNFNGGDFCRFGWSDFNPASHKQIIDILHEAGWSPVDRTQTHIDVEREINKLKHTRNRDIAVDLRLQSCEDKKLGLRKYGWKINENNLATLPPSAPPPARLLAKRILYEARRRTLTEWLGLVNPDTRRIHGTFQGIGAWTHRMAHQKPNTANIPNEYDTQGNKKLLGKELRSLWQAPKKRLLVGVDAEGIQLRIFAHYIDDPEFTKALVEGKKEDKSDPHSLNQRILGEVCKSRAAAKRFIYALLLGAGNGKLAQILDCSRELADQALARLLDRYEGFELLKRQVIPVDARRGWFTGLDGRRVRVPGDTEGQRRHLCMSGYLQNGEAVIMKMATLKWHHLLKNERSLLVNFVHDEWQTEVPNDMEIALRIASLQADSLRIVGEELKLRCPLAGSFYNEDIKDYTIGTNWSVTH